MQYNAASFYPFFLLHFQTGRPMRDDEGRGGRMDPGASLSDAGAVLHIPFVVVGRRVRCVLGGAAETALFLDGIFVLRPATDASTKTLEGVHVL